MAMIKVGNAQAFWGDRPSAAIELLAQVPELDFLTMDYLAEVSMSILAMQRERDPALGYARDFVEVVRKLAPYWATGGKCKLIANAGGINPIGCAKACAKALESAGCRSLKIAVVGGDDVLQILQSENAACFDNLDTQEPITGVQDRLVTANAYLGCDGIVQALAAGAEIVITGRVADPSMVVAPCVYTFGWKRDDWDRLAGATVAGHLLECGTHVTGGISTDWLDVPDPSHLGFPIAEIDEDGHCVITKSECSGGCVTLETVKEQLIYEIGNPDQYLSPDVTVSFLELRVEQDGRDRVRVSGARGRPCPKTLKVSATYRDGFRAAGTLTLFGPDSVKKARRCGEMVLQRLKEAGNAYRDTLIECLGNNETIPVATLVNAERIDYETILRIAVESESRGAVENFTRELMPLVTAGPQGTTGYAEGRPRVHEVFRYWPCLVDSARLRPVVELIEIEDRTTTNPLVTWPPTNTRFPQEPFPATADHSNVQPGMPGNDAKRLLDIAIGRSGDKGTGANVGIIVRSMKDYPYLDEWLTSERVHQFFAPLGDIAVQRFAMPNLGGFNFVIRGILRRALRNDAQGKSLAQALLSMPLKGVDHKSG